MSMILKGRRRGYAPPPPPPAGDITPPSQPGVITLSAVTQTSFTATWTPATDNVAVAGYEYSYNSGPFTDKGLALTESFSGLTAAQSFTLDVRAYDTSGIRGPVRSVTGSTLPASPAVPSTLLKATGTFNVSAGQTTIPPITGLGFRPKVVLFWFTGEEFHDPAAIAPTGLPNAGATVTDVSLAMAFGAWDGSNQWSGLCGGAFYSGRRGGNTHFDCILNWDEQDHGQNAKFVGQTFDADGFTVGIINSVPAGNSATQVRWLALGGCNAKVGHFTCPANGNYYNDIPPPQGITVTGLGFTPKAVITSVYGQGDKAVGYFTNATAGPSQGFAAGPTQQASVGSGCGYQGFNGSWAYDGFIISNYRFNTTNILPAYSAKLRTLDVDGFTVDMTGSDGAVNHDAMCYVALDCAAYVTQISLPTTPGSVGISGAGFAPQVALFAAAPRVPSNWVPSIPPASNATPPDPTISGNINLSFGCAINDGSNTQFGVRYYDQASPDDTGTVVNINGDNNHVPPSNHDVYREHFTGAVIKGTQRTGFQTFAQRGLASLSAFTSDGINLNVSEASGRTGKVAVLLLGDTQPSLGLNPDFNGFKPFPQSRWYTDVSSAPVHANSANWMSTIGSQTMILEGNGYLGGGGFSIYVVDSRTQPLVPVCTARYSGESDVIWAPIPLADDAVASYWQEPKWPALPSGADAQVIVYDRATGYCYEMYAAHRRVDHWYCANMAIWDTRLGDIQRPYGWTSADVAGDSLLMGVLRSRQVATDTIDHGIRYTVSHNDNHFMAPAMHAQSFPTGMFPLPFGARARLKAAKTIAGGPYTQRIVAAMKKYGIINADTGSAWAPSGDSYPLQGNYPLNTITQELQALNSTDFEFVETGETIRLQDGAYPTGTPPSITSLTSTAGGTPQQLLVGQSHVITPVYANHRKALLAPKWIQRSPGAVTDTPNKTTWYTLHVTSEFGSAKKSLRIYVPDGPVRATAYDFYVSPTGSMSNSGTIGSPFSMDVFLPQYNAYTVGMTIGLLDGTYPVYTLPSVANDIPTYPIPNGVPGKLTTVQAVNPRAVIFDQGARIDPVFGVVYTNPYPIQGLAGHIHLNGIDFVTTAAPYGVIFFGNVGDTALHLYDCRFNGHTICGAKIDGNYDQPLIHNCRGPAGKPLARMGGANNPWFLSNVAGAGGSIYEDYGGNTNVVITP